MDTTLLIILAAAAIVIAGGVYAAVMYGGMRMTEKSIDEDPMLRRQVEDEDELEGLPTNVKF